MKNTRKAPFVSSLNGKIKTSEGILEVPITTYTRFNEFSSDSESSSSYVSDLKDGNKFYKVVEGAAGAGTGEFSLVPGKLSDFTIYGSTVYTDIEVASGTKLRVPMKQKGFSLPLGGPLPASPLVKTARPIFLVREDVSSLDPHALAMSPNGVASHNANSITYMFKIRCNPTNTAKALFQVGVPASSSSFTVGFYDTNTLAIRHNSNGGSPATQSFNITDHKNKWITLFAQAYIEESAGVVLGPAYLFDVATGHKIDTRVKNTGSGTGVFSLTNPNAYFGYGEWSGGLNVAFADDDFLMGVDIAEFAAFPMGFTESTIERIARSHLAENQFKSGFNNRAPRKVQQILDAKTTYPQSSIPNAPAGATKAFNDNDTKIFGQPPTGRFIELDPLLSFAKDGTMDYTGVTSKTATWIACGVHEDHIYPHTFLGDPSGFSGRPLDIVGIDESSVEVMLADNAEWVLSTVAGVLPVGKYDFTFKMGRRSSSAGWAGHVIQVKLVDTITGASTIIKEIDPALQPDMVYGSVLSKFDQSVELNVTDTNKILQMQWNSVDGSLGWVAFWDFGFSYVPKTEMVFPEMLPANLFSGSKDSYGYSTNRGTVGDTSPFFRDIHNTPFEKRIVAPGYIRPGLSHKETEILNKSVRNSPVSLSKDTDILGGAIKPFNDSSPQARLYNTRAVSNTINPDFDQRLGDHVAIVIELDPSEETTIGVERRPDGRTTTGRVTSMAYYNFSSKKWETAGKNNDFIVPGARSITTSSASLVDSWKVTDILVNAGNDIVNSASIGFTGTSGFTIYENMGQDATLDLGNRGLPTTNYGFPFSKKYEAKDEQLIDLSEHIDAPFVLERVSFEFGAAIEESGPHSLGYKMPYLTPELVGTTDILMSYPACFYKTKSTTCSADLGRTVFFSSNDYSFVKRGSFLNGSPVVSIGDYHSTGFLKGGSDLGLASFTDPRATRVNQLIWGNSTPIPGDKSTRGFATTPISAPHYDGNGDGPNAISLQIQFLNPLQIKANRAPITSNKSSYALTALTASMFLKASDGPRKNNLFEANRTITGRTTIEDTASPTRSLPLSIIPVLAGGHNGIVTASVNTHALDFGKPVLGLYTNDVDDQKTDTTSDVRSWFSSEGGTPFWRADTFFLMKQSKNSIAKPAPATMRIKGTATNAFFPSVPFHQEAEVPASCVGVKFFHYGLAPFSSETNDTTGEQNQALMGAFNFAPDIISNSALNTGVPGKHLAARSDGSVLISIEDDSETTRDLITFGQMAHYGYANAAKAFEDIIWSDKLSHPYASGSFNTDAIAEHGDTPVDIYTQAIKIARGNDFGYSVIPCNLEDHGLKRERGEEQTSVFSDFPDTAQGQWSPPQESYNRFGNDFLINILPVEGTTAGKFAGSVNAAVQTRKTLSGPPGRSRYAVTGAAGYAPSKNETFYSLDTWAVPFVRTNESNEFDGTVSISRSALHIADKESGPPYVPLSDRETFAGCSFSPLGSGFSIISSPAYIASETRAADFPGSSGVTGSMGEEYTRFGSFTKTPKEWGDLEKLKASQRKSWSLNRPQKNWLDAGLSRDLNIFLSASQRHQGTNPDFNDNFCGFTILTASTVWRPFESPGRESASLPLCANVYKRQYLNYRTDFKIDVPVRAEVPRTSEAPGTWTFSCPNLRSTSDWTSYGTDLELDNKNNSASRINSRLEGCARFGYRAGFSIVEGGYVAGKGASGMGSNRRYQTSVTANSPLTAVAQASLGLAGVAQQFSAIKTNQITGQTGTMDPEAFAGLLQAGIVSGSFAKNPTVDSLYLLHPSDKLVLGVQPALPGWNPGSGLPNNRNANKYGIWDYSGSSAAGQALAWDSTYDGLPKSHSYINLDDPYEPSHGLTMLKVPSRVVLYGTFVSNNKPYAAPSTQVIGSDSIHEAIHYDNPILDQFQTGDRDDYAGSTLANHITGSIFAVQKGDNLEGERGVAGKLEDSSLVFSASMQRFSRLSENNEVFFDTLMHDPFDIAALSNNGISHIATGSAAGPYSIINLHMRGFPKLILSTSEGLKSWSNGTEYSHAFSQDWADSFPFEPKYASAKRLVSLETQFSDSGAPATIRLSPVRLPRSLSPSVGLATTDYIDLNHEDVPAADKYIRYGAGSTPNAAGVFAHCSGSDVMATDAWYDSVYRPFIKQRTSNPALNTVDGGYNVSGFDLVTIAHMADVRQATFEEVQSNFEPDPFPANPNSRGYQRQFFAAMAGYGRKNGKQLDIQNFRNVAYTNRKQSTSFVWSQLRGSVFADHPAGFKFGYMNSDHLNPSSIYRCDRYGQFRDMLEQRLYAKTYSKTSEFSPKGELESPISCIFVDQSGQPVSDPTSTSCLNISTAMTASKPFIEGEEERSIIINTDYVTIDAFSLDLPKLF